MTACIYVAGCNFKYSDQGKAPVRFQVNNRPERSKGEPHKDCGILLAVGKQVKAEV